jgi:diaminohydroxyphosphoribosylaminopyrimidine deaminase/5-amino-6-(5-phosphoribosylamino)uracil reductase
VVPPTAAPKPTNVDRALMQRAIELAGRGWGRVGPNPLVGAVVASEDEIVGEGFHPEFGQEHAEVRALRDAGEACTGATLYVTLEPCAHSGKTPPCVDAIIQRGIRRVVIACRDPNPQARGGIQRLREAGIDVAVGVGAEEAARANAAFLWSQRTGRPYLTLKLALSLDARIAERPGARTQISGPEAAAWVQHLRAGQDAILVGRVTAEVDDPRLTVRGEAPRRPPVRVVLDPDLRLSPKARLVATTDEAPLWLVAAPDAPPERKAILERAGARVLEVDRGGTHRLDLDQLMELMGGEGVTSVLVEGGGRVAASIVSARLAQRLVLIYAPLLLGPAGVPAFATAESAVPERWRLIAHRVLGADAIVELEPHSLRVGLNGESEEA